MMIALRLTLLFLVALAAYALARRRSASLRHAILVAAMAVSLVLPFLPALRRAEFAIPERVAVVARGAATTTTGGRAEARPTLGGFHVPWLTMVWLAGAMVCGLRIAMSMAAARRLFRAGAIDAPATIGVFRPAIVIPARLTGAERAAALAHESAHVRRRDPFTQLVARMACAVWWWHPFSWVILRLVVLEQERACDDAVLAAGIDGAFYADFLLAAAARRTYGAAMSSTRELERRLAALFEPRRRGAIRRRTAVTIGVAALTAATAVAAVSVSVFDDPVAERLPEVRAIARFTPAPSEAQLYQSLLQMAEKPKTWRGDLVAERARWALARAENGRILQPLRDALDDGDWRVRAYAAWCLGAAADRGATPRLIALLDDPVWRMRAMAAFALRASADPAAHAAMRRAAGDPAWQVRFEAASYLAALHDPFAETMTADPHVAVRAAAEEALRR